MTLAGLLGSVAFTLSGCGAGGGDSGADPGRSSSYTGGAVSLSGMKAELERYSGSVETLPSVAPVGNVSAMKGKTVWWVPLGTQVDASFGPTIKQALGKLGLDVHTCDGKFLPTTVASCLQQAGSQGADAVITGYVDYKSVPTAFDQLASQGIPVLLAGAVNNSGKKQSATFAFADTGDIAELGARLQLESAIVGSGGKGHLLWVGFTDSAQLAAVTDYAKTFVEKSCPGCTFDEISTTSAAMNKLSSQAGAALASHPNIDYVVVQIDPGVPSVVRAVQAAGKESKVKVVGSGALPDTMLTLQKGHSPLAAISGVSLSYEAWAFASSLAQMLGDTVPPAQVQTLHRVFTPENTKDLTVTPAEFGTVDWYADQAAVVASFTGAWGVS
ncbi:hypothetical protein JCM18899A_29680 [Nocardioides sp. AN3]